MLLAAGRASVDQYHQHTRSRKKPNVVSVTGDTYVHPLPIDLCEFIMRVETAWNVGGAKPDPYASTNNGLSGMP